MTAPGTPHEARHAPNTPNPSPSDTPPILSRDTPGKRERHVPMADRYGECRAFCSCGASSARMGNLTRIKEWHRAHKAKAKTEATP